MPSSLLAPAVSFPLYHVLRDVFRDPPESRSVLNTTTPEMIMLKKRYRVVIDFEVDILDITAEQIERSNTDRVARADEAGWADVEREAPSESDLASLRELQQRLLQDPAMLDLWIKHEVFADLMAESLQEFTYEFNEEEFLKPLVERLSPRARHRLREAMARDEVVEELEPFWASFRPTPKTIRITEIEGGVA